MVSRRTTIDRGLRAILLALIGLLVLQSLGYGIGFALHPAGGVDEFAVPPADTTDPLTIGLIGMLGVGMLGVAVLLVGG